MRKCEKHGMWKEQQGPIVVNGVKASQRLVGKSVDVFCKRKYEELDQDGFHNDNEGMQSSHSQERSKAHKLASREVLVSQSIITDRMKPLTSSHTRCRYSATHAPHHEKVPLTAGHPPLASTRAQAPLHHPSCTYPDHQPHQLISDTCPKQPEKNK